MNRRKFLGVSLGTLVSTAVPNATERAPPTSNIIKASDYEKIIEEKVAPFKGKFYGIFRHQGLLHDEFYFQFSIRGETENLGRYYVLFNRLQTKRNLTEYLFISNRIVSRDQHDRYLKIDKTNNTNVCMGDFSIPKINFFFKDNEYTWSCAPYIKTYKQPNKGDFWFDNKDVWHNTDSIYSDLYNKVNRSIQEAKDDFKKKTSNEIYSLLFNPNITF